MSKIKEDLIISADEETLRKGNNTGKQFNILIILLILLTIYSFVSKKVDNLAGIIFMAILIPVIILNRTIRNIIPDGTIYTFIINEDIITIETNKTKKEYNINSIKKIQLTPPNKMNMELDKSLIHRRLVIYDQENKQNIYYYGIIKNDKLEDKYESIHDSILDHVDNKKIEYI